MIELAISVEVIRWIIFLTFIFLWLFGAGGLLWIWHINSRTSKLANKTNKLSEQTHNDVVDIDRRLRLLESKSHDEFKPDGDSSTH